MAAGSFRAADSLESHAERASTPITLGKFCHGPRRKGSSASASAAGTSPALGSRLGVLRRRTAPMIHRIARMCRADCGSLAGPPCTGRGNCLPALPEPAPPRCPCRLGRSSLLAVPAAPQFISPSLVHRTPHPPSVGSAVVATRPSQLARAQSRSWSTAHHARADGRSPRTGRATGPGSNSVSRLSTGAPVRRGRWFRVPRGCPGQSYPTPGWPGHPQGFRQPGAQREPGASPLHRRPSHRSRSGATRVRRCGETPAPHSCRANDRTGPRGPGTTSRTAQVCRHRPAVQRRSSPARRWAV